MILALMLKKFGNFNIPFILPISYAIQAFRGYKLDSEKRKYLQALH